MKAFSRVRPGLPPRPSPAPAVQEAPRREREAPTAGAGEAEVRAWVRGGTGGEAPLLQEGDCLELVLAGPQAPQGPIRRCHVLLVHRETGHCLVYQAPLQPSLEGRTILTLEIDDALAGRWPGPWQAHVMALPLPLAQAPFRLEAGPGWFRRNIRVSRIIPCLLRGRTLCPARRLLGRGQGLVPVIALELVQGLTVPLTLLMGLTDPQGRPVARIVERLEPQGPGEISLRRPQIPLQGPSGTWRLTLEMEGALLAEETFELIGESEIFDLEGEIVGAHGLVMVDEDIPIVED